MSACITAGQRQMLFETEVLVRYLPRSRMLNHQLVGSTVGKTPTFKGGRESLLSPAYIRKPRAICLLLLTQAMALAFSLARASAGSSSDARMAIMAMTTSSSIKVKPDLGGQFVFIFFVTGRAARMQ